MFREILQSVENIETWPVIGLVIFFILFLGVLIQVLRIDKTHEDKMKNMPFDTDHRKEI